MVVQQELDYLFCMPVGVLAIYISENLLTVTGTSWVLLL